MSYDRDRAAVDPEYRARKNAERAARMRRQRERERNNAPPSLDELRADARTRQRDANARSSLHAALERIEFQAAIIAAYERFTVAPLRPVKPARLRAGLRPAAAVALLSDIHAEEHIERSDAIANDYSLAIARHRVARFFSGVTWLIKHASSFDVRTIVLALLGDLITGAIHEDLVETSECPPAEATLHVRDWIAAGIRQLLTELPDVEIRVPCSFGNHGRTTTKPRVATAYGHSWEWLMYQVLAGDFHNEPRVQFNASRDEMQYLKVFDFELAFAHGDAIRYNGGIGGVTIPAVKAAYRWDKWRACDYYHFGHFHQRIDLGQIAFNGSVIGPSRFGFRIGAAPEVPQQSFYLLDAKRGKTMASPVWVAE